MAISWQAPPDRDKGRHPGQDGSIRFARMDPAHRRAWIDPNSGQFTAIVEDIDPVNRRLPIKPTIMCDFFAAEWAAAIKIGYKSGHVPP